MQGEARGGNSVATGNIGMKPWYAKFPCWKLGTRCQMEFLGWPWCQQEEWWSNLQPLLEILHQNSRTV